MVPFHVLMNYAKALSGAKVLYLQLKASLLSILASVVHVVCRVFPLDIKIIFFIVKKRYFVWSFKGNLSNYTHF